MRKMRTIQNFSIAGREVPFVEIEEADIWDEQERTFCLYQGSLSFVPVYDYIKVALKKWKVEEERFRFKVHYIEGVKMLVITLTGGVSPNVISTICDELGVRGDNYCITGTRKGIEINIKTL